MRAFFVGVKTWSVYRAAVNKTGLCLRVGPGPSSGLPYLRSPRHSNAYRSTASSFQSTYVGLSGGSCPHLCTFRFVAWSCCGILVELPCYFRTSQQLRFLACIPGVIFFSLFRIVLYRCTFCRVQCCSITASTTFSFSKISLHYSLNLFFRRLLSRSRYSSSNLERAYFEGSTSTTAAVAVSIGAKYRYRPKSRSTQYPLYNGNWVVDKDKLAAISTTGRFPVQEIISNEISV